MSEPTPELRTVLVLDDEPQLLRLIARVLARAGCQVFASEKSEEALDLFRLHQAQLDAVILDMAIEPQGAGAVMEAMRQIRSDVGVVVTSGDLIDAPLREALKRCGGVFLRKPFDPSGLLRAVRTAKSGARPAGGA